MLDYSVYLMPDASFATHQTGKKHWTYDTTGIPYYFYEGYGPQRNPLFIGAEVIYHSQNRGLLGVSDFDRAKEQNDIRIALSNADWLLDNAHSRGNYSLVTYNFKPPGYDIDPPWGNAMAQARAILAMVEAHKLTNDSKYLDGAKRLLNAFYVDVKDGGIAHKSDHDGWWYEKNASREGPEPRILNGMMACLRDLYSYYEYTHDMDAKILFEKGILSLRNNIDRYYIDEPPFYGYSYYDAFGKPAPEHYHKYHVGLLSSLLEKQEDPVLRTYYDLWKAYDGPFPEAGMQTVGNASKNHTDFGNLLELVNPTLKTMIKALSNDNITQALEQTRLVEKQLLQANLTHVITTGVVNPS